jgi:hypothetical protein
MLDHGTRQDSVSLGNANGTKTLPGIDFRGLHKGLVFNSTVTDKKKDYQLRTKTGPITQF